MSMKHGWMKYQFNNKQRLEFYKKVISFVESGVALNDILERMAHVYGRKPGDVRAYVVKDIINQMRAGKGFYQSLKEWAPMNEIMLIKAGEEGGDLPGAMGDAVGVTTALIRMKKEITGGLIGPFFLLLVFIGMLFGFALGMVPILAGMIPPEQWEGSSRTLYAISMHLTSAWWIYLVGTVVLVIVLKHAIPKWTGPMRSKFDRIPPFSIYRTVQSSSFLIATAALMRTGVSFNDTLLQLSSMSTPYNKYHMEKMLVNMKAGRGDGESMDTGYFDEQVTQDIEFYGDSADFQKVMDLLGRNMVDVAIENVKSSANMANLGIKIMLGGFIGWAYSSFMTLTQSIGQNVS